LAPPPPFCVGRGGGVTAAVDDTLDLFLVRRVDDDIGASIQLARPDPKQVADAFAKRMDNTAHLVRVHVLGAEDVDELLVQRLADPWFGDVQFVERQGRHRRRGDVEPDRLVDERCELRLVPVLE
jgi:hypothetical protein